VRGVYARRARVVRIVRALENFIGCPQQARRLPPPLDMLIATILSQNTSDRNSHRAYTTLRARFPRWEDLATAPLASMKSAIRSGGMANLKAPRIQEILRCVKERYGAFTLDGLRRRSTEEVIAELTSLDGVGLKTAACVLVFSLGRDVFPVDTHVHRICNRLGLVSGCPTPEKTYSAMQPLIPKGKAYAFHTNLIRFGRKICRSASPACSYCPVYAECRYPGKRRRRSGLPASRTDHNFMLLDNIARTDSRVSA
jgi:endonuclease-3